MIHPKFLGPMVVGALLSGCSDPESGTKTNPNAGAAGTGGAAAGSSGAGGNGGLATGGASGMAGSAGAGGSAGGSSSTIPREYPPYWGLVQAISLTDFSVATYADARFSDPKHSQVTGRTCTTQTFGECAVQTCESNGMTPASAPSPHAGTITVNDGEGFVELLEPDAEGKYAPHTRPSLELSGGEMLSVVATGGDVPAFSFNLQYPLVLLITEPAAPATTGLVSWSRAQDLKLVFERGAPGVRLAIQNASGQGPYLLCDFASEAGTVTISASVLALIPPGTVLDLYSTAYVQKLVGDYTVWVAAVGGAMIPDRTHRVTIALN